VVGIQQEGQFDDLFSYGQVLDRGRGLMNLGVVQPFLCLLIEQVLLVVRAAKDEHHRVLAASKSPVSSQGRVPVPARDRHQD
jgi:hypothetical protein